MGHTPAKIVPIIDISGSMQTSSYITPAKSDADTFVNMFQPQDKFAVLAFNQVVARVYPLTANLTTNSNPNILSEASAAIQRLQASGSTNIGDAIKAANGLLQSESNPRGEVLLSDGMWNVGPDPLTVLPTGIPIYTIALGNNGQLDTLREIARRTGGQYFFAPDPIGLASIYYDILEKGKVGQIVTNALQTVTPTQPMRNVVKLPAGLTSASIAVNWATPGFAWTTNYPPAAGQITTRVLDPDFNPYNLPPVYRYYGFVVFTIANPKPGNWFFDTYFGGGATCNVTIGALEPTNDTQVRLVAPATSARAGDRVVIHGRAFHEEQLLAGVQVTASVDRPSITEADAMRTHAEALRGVQLQEEASDSQHADLRRLTALRAQLLPNVDILPRHRVPAAVAQSASGEFEITVLTDLPGDYMVRVETVGNHPNGGEFMRTNLICISAL
jgi:hypothetical protein